MIPIRLSFAALLLASASLLHAQPKPAGTPVLVELFTSEGCSSCPPADNLLAILQARQPIPGAHIVAIEEHVDYWDHDGWRDPFSSPLFTQRQNLYAPRLNFDDPYTPQMVVDGEAQFVGSDSSKAIATITQAARGQKIPLKLTPPTVRDRTVSGSISAGNAALPHGDLYAVLVEPSASTEVKSGENGGRRLHHVSVARSFVKIGSLQDLSRGPVGFRISAPAQVDVKGMRLIVFAQISGQGAVRGIVETGLSPSEKESFASASLSKHLE